MEYRSLGQSGLQVSLSGMGCNNFGGKLDQAESTAIVNAALDEGITFFDTAAMYNDGHSEECLGAALGSRRRGDAIVATKFAFPSPADVERAGFGASMGAASRDAIYKSVHGSLRRLGTDYIDVLFQHRPDKATPVEETLGALTDLIREGKVRYVGSSAFKGYQIADADWTGRDGGHTRFIAAQNEWNMLSRGVESDVVPACEQFGLGMVPFFPLANGFLDREVQAGCGFAGGVTLGGVEGDARSAAGDAACGAREAGDGVDVGGELRCVGGADGVCGGARALDVGVGDELAGEFVDGGVGDRGGDEGGVRGDE